LIGSLVNWLLAGPAGPKTLPYGAVYRLPAGKHTGILTHFQTKVDKKNGQKISHRGHRKHRFLESKK